MKPFRWALVRSLQLVALLSVLSGLYAGIRHRDVASELAALAAGGALFYLAAYVQRRWV